MLSCSGTVEQRRAALVHVLPWLERTDERLPNESLLLLLGEAVELGHSLYDSRLGPRVRVNCLRCSLRWRAARDGALRALHAVLAEAAAAAARPGCRRECDVDGGVGSALHAAAYAGQAAATAALLDAGEDANARDEGYQHRTPLMVAAERSHAAVVDALLLHPRTIVDAVDESLRTALSLAAAEGCARACVTLLEHGANPLAAERPPLRVAAADDDLPGRLLHGGAGFWRDAPRTALHRAAAGARDEGGMLCVRALAAAATRRFDGSALETRGALGHTPLAAALAAGAWRGVVVLAHAGAARSMPEEAPAVATDGPSPQPPAAMHALLAAPRAALAWSPELHALHPLAFRAAARALLLCATHWRRAVTGMVHSAAANAAAIPLHASAALGSLPGPLLMNITALLAREWCAAPPWPHELADEGDVEPRS